MWPMYRSSTLTMYCRARITGSMAEYQPDGLLLARSVSGTYPAPASIVNLSQIQIGRVETPSLSLYYIRVYNRDYEIDSLGQRVKRERFPRFSWSLLCTRREVYHSNLKE